MNSGKLERESEALRIMEALSGVDEELLARSEDTDGAAGTKEAERDGGRKVLRFVNRHGRALAACLCLVMLGAAYLTLELRTEQREEAPQNRSGGVSQQDTTNWPQESAEGAEKQVYLTGEAEGEGRADAWEERDAEAADVTDGCDSADGAWHGSMALEQDQNGSKVQGLSLEDARACEVLGVHVPETLPEEVEFRGASYVGHASEGRLVLTWWDGQRPFRLELSQTSFAEPEDAAAETGIAVYAADGDWEEAFWQPEEGGRLRFAVLYGDGVLAEYEGYLGKEAVLKTFGKWRAED